VAAVFLKAYGAYMYFSIESGFLFFVVYRSPDTSEAFLKCESVIKDLVGGKVCIQMT
jgi:Zn-dependent M16 (insulinase) family peptidase